MEKMKNIDYPRQRGCFMEINKETGSCSLVDYPTWSAKNGRFLLDDNKPLPEDIESEISFASASDARAWCEEQKYAICSRPSDKKTAPAAE